MVRYLRGVVRRRPRTALLILLLVVLLGLGLGGYGYAQHQWQAAQAAVKENRLDDARSPLDRCLLLWPGSVPVRLLAARAARLRGDFASAETHLNHALKLQNGATEAIQLEFLLMRVQRGDVDDVAPALVDLVESKHPDAPMILETLTGAYLYNHRYRPALACVNRWMEEVPDSAQPLHLRGWILERMNSREDAINTYRRALEIDPDHVSVRLRLAEILMDRSNAPEASQHLELLRSKYPDRADILARLGQCRYLQGQPEEARPLLEAAVEKLPKDPLVLISLARLELQAERPERAEEWLRRALEVDPADLEALYTLVTSLELQRRREAAAAALKRYQKTRTLMERSVQLLRDEAEQSSTSAETAFEIGATFLDLAQERPGLHWLHEALRRDPDHQPTHAKLAEHYERKNELQKAAAHRRRLAPKDRQTSGP